jgi:hypothetical protein
MTNTYSEFSEDQLKETIQDALNVYMDSEESIDLWKHRVKGLEIEAITALRQEIVDHEDELKEKRALLRTLVDDLTEDNEHYRNSCDELALEKTMHKQAMSRMLLAASELRTRLFKKGEWKPSDVYLGQWREYHAYAGQLAFNGFELTSLQNAVNFYEWLARRGLEEKVDFTIQFLPLPPFKRSKLHGIINTSLIGEDAPPVDFKPLVLKRQKNSEAPIYFGDNPNE